MRLQVKGRNLPVTDALYEHAERKISRVAKMLPSDDDSTQVELELAVERNPKIERSQIAEITVRSKGPVLRVRETADDMYVAIDAATRKLERQARRYRERRRDRRRGERARAAEAQASADGPAGATLGATTDAGREPRVTKEKRFVMRPMDPQDAALQMDLVEHDFFVFRNDRTNDINVVYRRRDGDVGLIIPEG